MRHVHCPTFIIMIARKISWAPFIISGKVVLAGSVWTTPWTLLVWNITVTMGEIASGAEWRRGLKICSLHRRRVGTGQGEMLHIWAWVIFCVFITRLLLWVSSQWKIIFFEDVSAFYRIRWVLLKPFLLSKAKVVCFFFFFLLIFLFKFLFLFSVWSWFNWFDHVYVFEFEIILRAFWVFFLWKTLIWLQSPRTVTWVYIVTLADFSEGIQISMNFWFLLVLSTILFNNLFRHT